jgi:hypothetical protein
MSLYQIVFNVRRKDFVKRHTPVNDLLSVVFEAQHEVA